MRLSRKKTFEKKFSKKKNGNLLNSSRLQKNSDRIEVSSLNLWRGCTRSACQTHFCFSCIKPISINLHIFIFVFAMVSDLAKPFAPFIRIQCSGLTLQARMEILSNFSIVIRINRPLCTKLYSYFQWKIGYLSLPSFTTCIVVLPSYFYIFDERYCH